MDDVVNGDALIDGHDSAHYNYGAHVVGSPTSGPGGGWREAAVVDGSVKEAAVVEGSSGR